MRPVDPVPLIWFVSNIYPERRTPTLWFVRSLPANALYKDIKPPYLNWSLEIYLRFFLHWTFRKFTLRLILTHTSLYNVLCFINALWLMEGWRAGVLLLYIDRVGRILVAVRLPVYGIFWVELDCPVMASDFVVLLACLGGILLLELVKLYHGEFLLKGTSSLLLYS